MLVADLCLLKYLYVYVFQQFPGREAHVLSYNLHYPKTRTRDDMLLHVSGVPVRLNNTHV